MPKSFLFTHKRYDYEDYAAATEVKVEVVEDDMEQEEDSNVLQDLSSSTRRRGRIVNESITSDRSIASVSSTSSGGYSEEDESFSPLPQMGRHRHPETCSQTKSGGQHRNGQVNLKQNYGYSTENKYCHPVAPKKRRLPPSTAFQLPNLSSSTTITALPYNKSDRNHENGEMPSSPSPQIHIKEELVIPVVSSPSLSSSFKGLLVSTTSTSLSSVPSAVSTITIDEKASGKYSRIKNDGDYNHHQHHRGNVIQYINQHRPNLKLQDRPTSTMSPPPPHHLSSSTSYQIKLVSPPPGGTLAHPGFNSNAKNRGRDEHLKLETMTPSPLQFIIAAAEQQEQAEEERMFIEGSRSEDSQQRQFQTHRHHHYHSQVEPTNHLVHSLAPQQEQPVNLSVKKVDLFNLTQLAEVSIAAAKREMMSVRSSNVSNAPTGSPSTTTNVSLMNSQSCFKSIPNHNLHHRSPLVDTPSTVPSTKNPSNNNGNVSNNDSTDENATVAVVAQAKNIIPKKSGVPELITNLIKTDTTTFETQQGANNGRKEDFGKIMAKLKKKSTSTSVTAISSSSPEKELRNGKNSAAVLPSSNCTITSNNSCASVSTSSSSSSSSSAASASQRHRCVECGKGFSTLSNLARHRQTHRSLSDASAVKKCPHCDKVYVSMPAFSMHLRTHNQGCKCPYCGKGFSRPWLLQGHIRTHTGEKPFKCGICSKAFADKSNLRAHTQTHSTEKPFACQRCGKLFALKSYLCKHIESSCMKSNRPSGSVHGGNGSSSGSSVVTSNSKKHNHHHRAINNSESSPVSSSSCSTRGTSPSLSSPSSSSSPTNRDIRCATTTSDTTTVTACSTTTTSSPSNLNTDTNIVASVAVPKKATIAAAILSKTPNVSTLGISSRNNNNEINRPFPKANNNNNESLSSNSRNKHNKTNGIIISASATATCSNSQSPLLQTQIRGSGSSNHFVGKSSKIRKSGLVNTSA